MTGPALPSNAGHWAASHIGMPWVAGVSDCWSFARMIWRDRFGWDVPGIPVDPSDPRAGRHALSVDPASAGWDQVAQPREGDAVLMARGAWPCHVGVWIAPEPDPGILHSVERMGVIFSPLMRLDGFRTTGFYRWVR